MSNYVVVVAVVVGGGGAAAFGNAIFSLSSPVGKSKPLSVCVTLKIITAVESFCLPQSAEGDIFFKFVKDEQSHEMIKI